MVICELTSYKKPYSYLNCRSSPGFPVFVCIYFPVEMSPIKKGKENRLREIEVLIISAQDLKNVKHVTKMRAYAVVYVEHEHVAKTHVDEDGGVNPTWNEKLTVKFREGLPETDVMAALNVDIYAHGHVREKPVGSARVLLCDVLKEGDASEPVDNPIQCLTLQVRRASGRPQGLLNLWVPPTGRFMQRRESLSFNVKDEVEVEVGDDVAVDEKVA
ncbi:BON1-associated protein 2-like [Magnolia sinica]|uniref:BON1-associated protein 2-like n=1 Tax=Magnolia sinica TaxID=86752 RepID=UPI002658B66D|nr:BON1-associated protein 2-like [Magnolia sinica]